MAARAATKGELPVQNFIAQYGYLAVFLLMLAESACIPVPSEVIMLFGGALAAGAVPGVHPVARRDHRRWCPRQRRGQLHRLGGGQVRGPGGRAPLGTPGRDPRERDRPRHRLVRAARLDRRARSAGVVPVVRTFISLPAGFAACRPFGSACSRRSAASRGRPPWPSRDTRSARTGKALPTASTAPPTRSRASSWWSPCGRRHRAVPPRQAAPRRHPGNPWAEHGEFAGARGTSADFRITSRPLSAASAGALFLPG